MNEDRLVAFIRERHAIYVRRQSGQPKPWTQDPILQRYRFCNVFRNLDTQTILIHDNWLHPHKGNEHQWFAMVVARLVNWWPSLEAVGYPVPWNPRGFVNALTKRDKAGEKVYTGAYMVRADAQMVSAHQGKVPKGAVAAKRPAKKYEYHSGWVLGPMWRDRDKIKPRKGDCLQSFYDRLMPYKDMGSFMVGQVIADLKYDEGSPLNKAHDWGTWACSGPGSRRGLNRVLARPVDAPWTEGEWRHEFARLHKMLSSKLEIHLGGFVSGQDLQNCLCEFDKYERVRLGEGTPRSTYNGV